MLGGISASLIVLVFLSLEFSKELSSNKNGWEGSFIRWVFNLMASLLHFYLLGVYLWVTILTMRQVAKELPHLYRLYACKMVGSAVVGATTLFLRGVIFILEVLDYSMFEGVYVTQM